MWRLGSVVWGEVPSGLVLQSEVGGVSFAGGDDGVGGVGVGGSVGEGLGDGDGGEVTT